MKKALIGLTAFMEIFLAVFLIVLLLFAENKFLSVQNIEYQKEAKRIALFSEALQGLDFDFEIVYGEINGSIYFSDESVVITSVSNKKYSYPYTKIFSAVNFDCKLEYKKISSDDGIEYQGPLLVFYNDAGDIKCKDGNE